MKKLSPLLLSIFLLAFILQFAQAVPAPDDRLLRLFNDSSADLVFLGQLNEPGYVRTRTWGATEGEAYIAGCFVTVSPTDRYTIVPAKIGKYYDGHPQRVTTWLAGAEHFDVIWQQLRFVFVVAPPPQGRKFVPVYCMVKRGRRSIFGGEQ